MNSQYRGRFAPSPTGPLHFGSLVAAVGSYLEAQHQDGEWLVRMEDLDPPREMPGAAADILRCLEAFGFEWQGEVLYQSQRQQAYCDAIDQLTSQGLTFACECSRKQLAAYGVYPGTCRQRSPAKHPHNAVRIITQQPPQQIMFNDRLQGPQQQNIASEVGDFVIRRADSLFAYQLAVVVDDAEQGITEVVRGSDLLPVTARQIYLQHCLGLNTPSYGHLPIAINAAGEKLSKQTFAKPLAPAQATPQLWMALAFLGQQPPTELQHDRLELLWQWAREHWCWSGIPAAAAVAPDY